MARSLPQLNRFFVSSDYSVYYRRVKQLRWESQPVSGYSLLTVLKGRIEYVVSEKHGELSPLQSLIMGPNISAVAVGQNVEFLFLIFSSSLVIQHALTMKLVAPKSTVTFSLDRIESDRKLSDLIADFSTELRTQNPGKKIVITPLVRQALVQILSHNSIIRPPP